MATSSSVSSSESATAKDMKQKKSVNHSRVAVLSSHDRLEVTRSLQSREKRLLQGIESLIANGDSDKKRDYLET